MNLVIIRVALSIKMVSFLLHFHSFLCLNNIPYRGLPQWLRDKESACNAGDMGGVGSVPGSGRSPGGGNGNPLQYSFLENPMDREA